MGLIASPAILALKLSLRKEETEMKTELKKGLMDAVAGAATALITERLLGRKSRLLGKSNFVATGNAQEEEGQRHRLIDFIDDKLDAEVSSKMMSHFRYYQQKGDREFNVFTGSLARYLASFKEEDAAKRAFARLAGLSSEDLKLRLQALKVWTITDSFPTMEEFSQKAEETLRKLIFNS